MFVAERERYKEMTIKLNNSTMILANLVFCIFSGTVSTFCFFAFLYGARTEERIGLLPIPNID
jgi:hypothetical protein